MGKEGEKEEKERERKRLSSMQTWYNEAFMLLMFPLSMFLKYFSMEYGNVSSFFKH